MLTIAQARVALRSLFMQRASPHDPEFELAARKVEADRRARERAGLLRGVATSVGLWLVAGGLVSLLGVVANDHAVGIVFAFSLLAAGLTSVGRAVRARRISLGESISTDLLVVAAGLIGAAVAELAHSLAPRLEGNLFHLPVAVGLGWAGAVLWTTRDGGGSSMEVGAVRALHAAGAGLLLAAFVRSLLYVWDDVHGAVGTLAMLLVAASGVALVHAVRSSPPAAWARL